MKKIFFLLVATLAYSATVVAQPTFPQNGIYDTKEGYVAFTNATIYVSYDKKIENATLVIHNGTVESVAANGAIPQGAAAVDCTGKTIYPSFIDMFSSYGLPDGKAEGNAPQQRPQMLSNKKGAFSWNEALKAEFRAADAFLANEAAAKELRDIGFGAVCTHRSDGISRGSAAIVTLGNDREHLEIVRDLAAHVLSFKKGSSTQDYPSSLMGSIALLRQAYLDADWYKKIGRAHV